MSELKESIERIGGQIRLDGQGRVVRINLSFKEFGDDTASLFRTDELSEVRTLYLAGTDMTDAALAMLEFLPKLETLNLSETKITGTGFHGSIVARLKTLMMRACSDVSIIGLSRIAEITSIETLDLSESNISVAGLEFVAKLPNLSGLRLDDTGLTDAGLAELSMAKQLRRLSVENTNVTPEGIADLERALPSLKFGLIM